MPTEAHGLPSPIPYAESADELGDGESIDVDPADTPRLSPGRPRVLRVESITHGADADLRFRSDSADVRIDTLAGVGRSGGNALYLYEKYGQTLRLTNTSGSPADFEIGGVCQ